MVLRKQKFHPVGAIAATYIFTFPLVMAAQNTHIQLAPRFMVPVAFWMAFRFAEQGEGKYLRRLPLACAYQIYLGIYTGYFLILSIGSSFVFLLLFQKRWNSVRDFFQARGPRSTFRRGVDYSISCFCFLLGVAPVSNPLLPDPAGDGASQLGRHYANVAALAVVCSRSGILSLGKYAALGRGSARRA